MQTEQQTQERRIVNPRKGRFDTEKSSGAKNCRLEIQRGKQKRWMEMVATNSGAERTSLNEFQMLKFFKSKWKRFWIISLINIRREHRGNKTRFGLCIKVGRGQGDGDIETRVWGLGDARRGTWGHQVWDAGTCGTGTGDRGRQKLGCRGRGMWMIIAKVGDKCDISFFAKMCYLCSTLDSIFQNHIKHLLMFTQNTSFY